MKPETRLYNIVVKIIKMFLDFSKIRSVADPSLYADVKFYNEKERFNVVPCAKDSIRRSGEQVITNHVVPIVQEITLFLPQPFSLTWH